LLPRGEQQQVGGAAAHAGFWGAADDGHAVVLQADDPVQAEVGDLDAEAAVAEEFEVAGGEGRGQDAGHGLFEEAGLGGFGKVLEERGEAVWWGDEAEQEPWDSGITG